MVADRSPARVAGLLSASLVLVVLDVVILGLCVAFGPGGFGGDRTMTDGEVRMAHLGQAAGVAGCLLWVVALIWAVAARSARRRRRGVAWLVGAQLATTALLLAAAR